MGADPIKINLSAVFYQSNEILANTMPYISSSVLPPSRYKPPAAFSA